MTKVHASQDSKINHLKLLTIIVLVSLAGYFIGYIINRSYNFNEPQSDYLKITAQLLTVFISLSIFSTTWIASDRNPDNHSLFLGFTFLIIGFLNLFNIFSYPSMPGFYTPNSENKAAFFLIESRTFLALLFLASVYIHKDTSPKLINKIILMSLSLVLSVVSVSMVILYNNYLFTSYDFSGFARTSGFHFFMIAVIILYASYLYARRSKETGEKDLIFLIYGIVIIIFSNLVYTSFEYSGTFLMITGYYFIYFGLYNSSVILPYENLAMAEERLHRASEENYSNLIDNANDAIITTDLENRITGWNKAAEKLFGWTAHEVSGKIFSSLLASDNPIADKDKRDENAMNGMLYNSMETVSLRKDGTKINVSLTISPILNEDKKVIGLFAIIRDITERKLAEKRLMEANMELKRADELKTEFLSIISHELRTPITPMNAQLQMMLAGYFGELTEKQKNSLKMIQRNTTRLDGLIGDVLDISKLEAGVMKFNLVPASINEIVEHAVETMKIDASNKNHKLVLNEDKVPEIKLDKDRITQVMMDLLNNAIKFTDAGGEIDVELSCNTENAIVKVKDSGIGIKKEDIDKLFKPFQQLDPGLGRKYEGTGLGLAICKKIIMNHGGNIWVESEFGKGTAFIFSIPIIHEVKEEKVESIMFEMTKSEV